MIQLVKGTKDIYGAEVKAWQEIEGKMRRICETFGIGEIRTPAFEFTELFARGVGETTDIVQKEMYTFTDDGDRSLALRPEGTAGAVRAAGPATPGRTWPWTASDNHTRPATARL